MESSKVIIGINAYHADSSACLLINGKLVCAIEEERLNRKKHYSGFPFESINECLEIANLNELDITDVAFNTRPISNILAKGTFYLKNLMVYQLMGQVILSRLHMQNVLIIKLL